MNDTQKLRLKKVIEVVVWVVLFTFILTWRISCRRHALERVVGHKVSIMDTITSQ